ncbi:peptidylprolyl isomerase [Shewanella gelidimarina]|uniref:peptidylprolyl isomerase n=1 Tax=Shewanella gelidimarina TaxID=56813 RepID=UPI00200F42FF|nr:peptidylprolyl isomerase [Shewanella gelidimarina]MCL1058162.1 peptidylprolyl isomerase [Shewanella gelidimarina]
MKKLFPLLACLTIVACGSESSDSPDIPEPPKVVPELKADVCYLMSTTKGDMTLAIDLTNMPVTGKNFKEYVDSSFYNGTLFHRTINNFMIQGGGFTTGLVFKPTNDPIINEASVGISNDRSTVAMARTDNPNSATSQFFINVLDNPHLNASASSAGYAVFGQVISGMEVADQISIVTTQGNDIPVDEILINSVVEISCPTS